MWRSKRMRRWTSPEDGSKPAGRLSSGRLDDLGPALPRRTRVPGPRHDRPDRNRGRAEWQDRMRNPLLSVLARALCSDIRSCRAGALGGGEPPALGAGCDLPRRSGALQDRRWATEHGHHPPYRAQSAVTRQTDHQPEEPAETGRVERQLPGCAHPTDRMTFKRFPCQGATWAVTRKDVIGG